MHWNLYHFARTSPLNSRLMYITLVRFQVNVSKMELLFSILHPQSIPLMALLDFRIEYIHNLLIFFFYHLHSSVSHLLLRSCTVYFQTSSWSDLFKNVKSDHVITLFKTVKRFLISFSKSPSLYDGLWGPMLTRSPISSLTLSLVTLTHYCAFF